MKTIRLFGGLAFALGLFVAVFAGVPWFVYHDPMSPWWLKAATYCLMGGVLVVLLTAAAESRAVRAGGTGLLSGESKSRMLVQTTSEVPGREVVEVYGMVRGHTVYAIALSKDISALMRMLLGGELVEYAEMMGQARDIATARMVSEAEQLGADAIINARYVTASIIGTAAELLAYGTAVRLSSPAAPGDQRVTT
jgi:uncharacterized protein YbjQ (UPF0145 family)